MPYEPYEDQKPSDVPPCSARAVFIFPAMISSASSQFDALPLACASFADALQGVLQTVGIVDALRLAEALHAQAAAMSVLARIFHSRDLHRTALAHSHLQRTTAAAVAATLRF